MEVKREWKATNAKESYRLVKSYLHYPEKLDSISNQLIKVLDLQKTGFYKKEDLL